MNGSILTGMTHNPSRFEWEAELYHRVSSPQLTWGRRVLDSLELRGDEAVLDAGCGTGLVTALLLERIPRGRVTALDASAPMLEVARRNLAPFGERVAFVRAVLAKDALPTGFDLVFSTATFHWVKDHDTLFHDLSRALVPGGRLCVQCGGETNLVRAIRSITAVASRAPYAAHLEEMAPAWYFAGVADTRRRLAAAGFVDCEVWLEEAPAAFATAVEYEAFIRSSVVPPFLARLPEELHSSFIAEIAALAAVDTPPLTLDYVRLNVRAKKQA